MGNNNRQIAVQEFSQELVIAQFMSVYRDLLRSASLGTAGAHQAPAGAKEGAAQHVRVRAPCAAAIARAVVTEKITMALHRDTAKRVFDVVVAATALVA